MERRLCLFRIDGSCLKKGGAVDEDQEQGRDAGLYVQVGETLDLLTRICVV
jgi:hypothetical protein